MDLKLTEEILKIIERFFFNIKLIITCKEKSLKLKKSKSRDAKHIRKIISILFIFEN